MPPPTQEGQIAAGLDCHSARAGQGLGGERLVELDRRQVGPADPRSLQSPCRCGDRADAEALRLDAAHCPGHDPSQRPATGGGEPGLVGQEQARRAVVERRGTPRRHRAVRAEGRAELRQLVDSGVFADRLVAGERGPGDGHDFVGELPGRPSSGRLAVAVEGEGLLRR